MKEIIVAKKNVDILVCVIIVHFIFKKLQLQHFLKNNTVSLDFHFTGHLPRVFNLKADKLNLKVLNPRFYGGKLVKEFMIYDEYFI